MPGRFEAQVGDIDVEAFAQIDGGAIGRLFGGGRPQVECVAAAAALEAAKDVLVDIRREATARA